MTKKILLPLAFALVATLTGWAQKLSPIGVWANEEKKGTFEIYQCGSKLCAKIVSLTEPNDKHGKPRTDVENPDPKLKTRPMMGLVFMEGFEPTGNNKWENGTIYDPKNGKTYSSYMKMLSANTIEVRGFIGFSLIGRSQTWSRVK